MSAGSGEMRVPLLDLRVQYGLIQKEVQEAVLRVLASQAFILGPEVSALEREIAEYCRCRRAVGCASGSDAILLVLMALGVGPGHEVLCPSYTFFATAGSVARLGAVPVFADIDPVTYNLDIESARAAAARCRKLAAIMPVHLFGQPADMEAFDRLGGELGVPVIEDAAQALGAIDVRSRRAGALSHAACFSFFPSKNLGGCGDGGMVTTDDDSLADKVAALRVHGSPRKYHHEQVGINSRLDALQAAILRVKLRHLEKWNASRRANAATYDRAFAAAGAATSAAPQDSGELPLQTPHPAYPPAAHIYNQYVIRVPAALRDPLREHLRQRGIGTEVYYPVPLHLQPCFAYLGHARGDLPVTESAAAETLALPIYPELTGAQQALVVESVVHFLGKAAAAVGVKSPARGPLY